MPRPLRGILSLFETQRLFGRGFYSSTYILWYAQYGVLLLLTCVKTQRLITLIPLPPEHKLIHVHNIGTPPSMKSKVIQYISITQSITVSYLISTYKLEKVIAMATFTHPV